MSNETSAAEQVCSENGTSASRLTEEQVVAYLRNNSDFFIRQEDLLADLSLPHESGKAISLLEKQVTILRDRGIEARHKLNDLLKNARNNDNLFETTRSLVLSLMRAGNVTEIAEVTDLNVSQLIKVESLEKLKNDFNDVFRLKRTHCGAVTEEHLAYLFPDSDQKILSTALCPVISNCEILALLAFGNRTENYFNVNLDTLFLDFIGHVVGAALDRLLLANIE